jgi:uncharacterized protein YjbJ (UPF0337 family)
MIWEQIAGNWKQFRGKVKKKWSNSTEDNLDWIEENRDRLVGLIQERFGQGRAEAEKSADKFLNVM